MFRINWKNDVDSGGIGDNNFLEIPKEITGVNARIIGLVGKFFPTGAHKVGATYGCLAPYLVTGRFNPEYHKAVLGGLILGAMGLLFPQILGIGYGAINLALAQNLSWWLIVPLPRYEVLKLNCVSNSDILFPAAIPTIEPIIILPAIITFFICFIFFSFLCIVLVNFD